jgi:hypothetical protein
MSSSFGFLLGSFLYVLSFGSGAPALSHNLGFVHVSTTSFHHGRQANTQVTTGLRRLKPPNSIGRKSTLHGYGSRLHWMAGMASSEADGILQSWERERDDETDDAYFYSSPRLVYHQDHDSLARLTALYRQLLPSGCTVVDLMSSWISHLPQDIEYASIIGILFFAIGPWWKLALFTHLYPFALPSRFSALSQHH